LLSLLKAKTHKRGTYEEERSKDNESKKTNEKRA